VYLFNVSVKLAFMSTNRHRVYRYISDIAIDHPEQFENGMITAIQFKGIVDSLKSSQVELAIAVNHLVLRDRNTIYFGRLMDGNYPQINHIFDKSKDGAGEISESFPGARVEEGFPTIKLNAKFLRDALLVGDREVKNIALRTCGVTVPGFIEFVGMHRFLLLSTRSGR
jgi:DNA polymerase-3 subunit beta